MEGIFVLVFLCTQLFLFEGICVGRYFLFFLYGYFLLIFCFVYLRLFLLIVFVEFRLCEDIFFGWWDFLFFGFCFDFSVMVCWILFFVNLVFVVILFYSFYYMFFDLFILRFCCFLFFFVLFMNWLVCSYGLFDIYVGWEFLGLFSFLLISYWFYRLNTVKCSFRALLISKLGDFCYLISYLLFVHYNVNFTIITSFRFMSDKILWHCVFLLLCCSFSKSTQFGLHIWLPDAMEGPIPVSSLIHALTLVTIGIILVFLIWFFIDVWFSFYMYTCFWISTVIFCLGFLLTFQMDIKRIVAYSTIYQICVSMFVSFVVDYSVGCFLFIYHMFYKSTLFMLLGAICHVFFNLQDVRQIVYLHSFFLLSSVLIWTIFDSLAIWFVYGFYVKDYLVELLIAYDSLSFEFVSLVIWLLVITTYYNLYLFYLKFVCNGLIHIVLIGLYDFEVVLVLFCVLTNLFCVFLFWFSFDFLYVFLVYVCSLWFCYHLFVFFCVVFFSCFGLFHVFFIFVFSFESVFFLVRFCLIFLVLFLFGFIFFIVMVSFGSLLFCFGLCLSLLRIITRMFFFFGFFFCFL